MITKDENNLINQTFNKHMITLLIWMDNSYPLNMIVTTNEIQMGRE